MRRPRRELPGVPLHVTHRGVNRAATFRYDEDCSAYLQAPAFASSQHDVALHAYVRMSDHVHLLVGATQAGTMSRMMQSVGRRYVRAFNECHGRTGTLWKGRFKSCLVDSDGYLLACLRYIELNPVRAAMVALPWEYRWSSVHMHLGLRASSRVSLHPGYLALADEHASRAAAYRALLLEPLTVDQLSSIRDPRRQERALGCPRFQVMVEKTLNRPAQPRVAGRPRHEHTDSNGNVLCPLWPVP